MNNDTRNMILAIVLSALVLFGWGFLSERFFPQPKQPAATAQTRPGATPAAPTSTPATRAMK